MKGQVRRVGLTLVVLALGLCVGLQAIAYPLDGAEATGIMRLRGYQEFQERLLARGNLQPGALLGTT